MTCSNNILDDLVRGDTRYIDVTITDVNGLPANIQNNLLFFTLKTDTSLADSLATLQVQVTVPADSAALNGSAVLTLPSTSMATVPPGKYYYDIQWVVPGSPPVVTTVLKGQILVSADVTVDVA